MNEALSLTMADLEAPVVASRPDASAEVAAAYDRHVSELHSFALRASRDREAAEDLVHEAYLRLFVELEAGRAPDNVRAWLYRVTANLVASRGRRATVAQRWLSFFASTERPKEPEPLFLDMERRSSLEAVLAELSVDARTALLLASHGFRGDEIAAAIGRSEAATRTLMCRARLRLRERLTALEASA
jgi:RNA polymerase sigma-70 factor (ECF subfamily)